MKLFTFVAHDQVRLGAAGGGQLVDLAAAYAALRAARGPNPAALPSLPTDLLAFLRLGEPALTAARESLAFMARRPALPAGERAAYLFEEVRVLAPLLRPGKILCSGINYHSHLDENPGAKLPAEPFFFSKLPSAVIGPGEAIVCPKLSRQVDYEVELAVVIGRTLQRASEQEVMRGVAGYTILHDVSARDVQFKDNQITLGKNFDTFCPLGPCVVTPDELADPARLQLRSFLNGQLMQDGRTSDWVFPLPVLLSRLAQVMTLEAGDIVSTGTPAGVGVFRKPPVFLRPGDLVRLEIEGIGVLENPVVAAA
jgi:2,4-diketo-3-deoxy-L-fuconate hydrolase